MFNTWELPSAVPVPYYLIKIKILIFTDTSVRKIIGSHITFLVNYNKRPLGEIKDVSQIPHR